MSVYKKSELLKNHRVEKGFSREKLSEGICDSTTLKRYENEGMIPSDDNYRMLQEKMGGRPEQIIMSYDLGLFVDEAALLKHCPKPLVGQWALVMIENRTDEDGNAIGRVYVCQEDGQWEDAGYNGGLDGEGDALLTEREERKEGDLAIANALLAATTALAKEKEDRKNDVYKLQHAIDVLFKELNDYKHSGGDPDMDKYQSRYIGAGNSYDDVMHVAYSIPVTEDAHATYNVACGSGEHIIIVIKSTLIENFLRADMNGFEISFTTSEVTVGDIAYTVLTSENVFAMGTYNIDLTMSFPKTEE